MRTMVRAAVARATGALLAALTGASLFAAAGPASPAAAATCPTREASHPAGKAPRIAGWVHTCGNKVVDSRRHVVRPDAVASWEMSRDNLNRRSTSPCMHWTKPPSESYAKLARWGFNSVLLYISWANVENRRPTKVGGHLRHHYNRGYLRALSSVVHAYSSRGIKVILAMGNNRWSSAFTNLTLPNGMHVKCGSGAPAWLYSRSSNIRHMVNAENSFFHSSKLIGWFARAWKVVAHRFARNRGVIGADILHESYDLLAQPYPGSGGITPRTLHLAGFYERVGRAIHKANRHLLLLTADWRSWGRPRFFAITRRPRLSNAAETFEFYASNWSTSGRTRLRVYRRRANNWHRPAWAEEFFAFLPTSSTAAIRPSWRTSSKGFLTFTKKVKVGWAFAPYTRLATNDPPRLARVLKTGFCVGSLTC